MSMAPQLYNFSGDPYQQLKDRVHLCLKEDKLEDRIFGVVKEAYTQLLKRENIILSRTEQTRLLRDILKDELGDMLAEL